MPFSFDSLQTICFTNKSKMIDKVLEGNINLTQTEMNRVITTPLRRCKRSEKLGGNEASHQSSQFLRARPSNARRI